MSSENSIQNENGNVNINDIVASYTKHWKWFLLAVIISLIFAFVYLRYATKEYAAMAKIEIIKDKNSNSELSAFSDLGNMNGGTNEVADEIEVLNSRSNFIKISKDLNLNLKIIALGNIKDSEIYSERPIKINFISSDSIVDKSSFEFYLELSSATSFGYSLERDTPFKVYGYGKTISTKVGDIVITPNQPYFDDFENKKLKVALAPVHAVASRYKNKILIAATDDDSSIITISLTDAIQQKAVDIINSLVKTYNDNAVADKIEIANKTSDFINERIRDISSDLSSADQTAEDFKSSKGLNDIASEANLAMNVGAANRQELENAKMQLNIASGIKDFVSNEGGYEVLPTNIGLSDPTITNTTAKYNELVAERNRLLQSADQKNPIIVNLDQQLNSLKSTMTSSLAGMERNLGMQVNNLSGQLSRMNAIRYSAPKNQRQLTDITRQQQTTESLYLYLLQKREEAQINAASSPAKSKIIDLAYGVGNQPIKPKVPIIYLASVVLGLLVPFGVIYSSSLLDTKINNKVDLENLISQKVPVLAELPKIGKKESLIINKDDRSVLSESLRILRTNLDYLIKSSNTSKNNIIFVTSSVPGEGKTFLASNLSMILASTDKKVLLVGADIRNPKLYNFFTHPEIDKLKGKPSRSKNDGLTEYLYNKDVSVDDIINPMLAYTNTIDVIYSGKIPPNPAELLMSSKMKSLFDQVSQSYDYVVVDTAPLLVVTDTLLISEFANHTLYVTRAGVTEKKVVEHPLKLKKEGKLKGLSFIVNGVDNSNLGYGGKYGYGYSKTTKKWWKF